MQLSQDSIFRGQIKVLQPRRQNGYRFSVDSVLLGAFASSLGAGRGGLAVDLGAGSGIVGFVLLWSGAAGQVLFVEHDELLAHACTLGIDANGFQDRAKVIRADARSAQWRVGLPEVGLVVCNPPYYRRGMGQMSARRTVASARHEIAMTLGGVVEVALSLLGRSGRLCLVVASERVGELFDYPTKLDVVRLRFIHSKKDRDASSVLAEMRPASGRVAQTRIMPPLVLMNDDGTYTMEAAAILEGKLPCRTK